MVNLIVSLNEMMAIWGQEDHHRSLFTERLGLIYLLHTTHHYRAERITIRLILVEKAP
jgi:hypothetical protein